ncbi:unnamed protein product [Zymoseptoria tritici ST99CH_1A5]|uniref:FYVE-type domain-containing protein n=2 Tax=Zymoseptoria tritici TaxID=1047171 RepID=A0A1X7RKY6_ZYMT9|nr:unnamed protein product [Zymoseptoria tritici ST99CH_3D7]SMR47865.1 unnamed protein product [Zymoseptoria tritici ST99CH_3D1]SMY21772.1 unnamed protein product [Zymoseptoria tritici ST99CH_1A5]
MATTTIAAPAANTSNYYMNPHAGPSPPDTLYSKNHYDPRQSQSQDPSPTNISPTSFHSGHSNHHNNTARQLRQPRQPLYVPAALRPENKLGRPTDIPTRPRAPDTPPASTDSSFDSIRTDSASTLDLPASPFTSGSSLVSFREDASLRRGLTRAESDALSEELGEVTGAPTTAHWKPDASAVACYICAQQFTFFFRRHHCRRCGNLVCDQHIKHTVPLDQNARYHPNGTASKACKSCWDGWKVVRRLHHSRAGSIAESSNSSQGTAMPIPSAAKKSDGFRIGSMARSEGGMVWSTF